VNSAKCLLVLAFYALNTGAISNTLFKSPKIAICL